MTSRSHRVARRTFLATASTAGLASTLDYAAGAKRHFTSKNDRPRLALIGAGFQPATQRQGRGIAIGKQATRLGDIVQLCEIDQLAMEYALANVTDTKAQPVHDYRKVLDTDDIDAVLIATPDHWHAKIAIEAMRAGKDVYCEKPVAVTIGEGQKLTQVAAETGRVFQVGTQQRSEYNHRFLQAIALVQQGRIGTLQEIHVGLGKGWKGGPFPSQTAPKSLDWEMWQGPAPSQHYLAERVHRTFRWWFEYAGGQICDWGAHHVDIAQWALGTEVLRKIEGTAQWNQPLRQGNPTRTDSYNTPIQFDVKCTFSNDVLLRVDSSRNGITFTGSEGRFFVNRGTLEGRPVSQLSENPLPENAIEQIYRGQPTSHMQNFFNCLVSRELPVSDIESHHRHLTTCHLANLCLRLDRPLAWDAEREQVIGDEQANAFLHREYRTGFEIDE